MAELKTKPTKISVEEFLNLIEDKDRRKDCFILMELMKKTTKQEPTMWGGSIVGFGSYHYKYASGHEGDAPILAFSPQKQNVSIYGTNCIDNYQIFLDKLGKYKTGKGCLYINKLNEVNITVLEEFLSARMKSNKKLN